MKHILESLRKRPSRIILAGDSAGATLALNVVAHVTHPFPGISQYEGLKAIRFRGLLLLSAWADFRAEIYPSYKAHDAYDVLKSETLGIWYRSYLSFSDPDVWSAPCLANSSWWKDLHADSVLLTAGSDECMRDVVVQLEKSLQVSRSDLISWINRCDIFDR